MINGSYLTKCRSCALANKINSSKPQEKTRHEQSSIVEQCIISLLYIFYFHVTCSNITFETEENVNEEISTNITSTEPFYCPPRNVAFYGKLKNDYKCY